ncbi:hypothetical protein SMB34_02480 [Thalassospira permensis NBRC 106175]|uniref:Uncharacterized protein n=1 Tax=Thalassospira permensis NBRC 106175 TaxID=1353532 RepID=A0ABR4TPK8_9PROT|nr:hypothetical protein SMB34_02480 [Thalassospira permensis NBRC 106175]
MPDDYIKAFPIRQNLENSCGSGNMYQTFLV